MPKTETFRSLVLKQRSQTDGRLTPMRAVADACGCSRAWLYMLMSGNFGEIPEETLEAIAAGLDVSVRRVRRALQTSQEEAYA